MSRFISMLLSWVVAGNITYTQLQDTWFIQNYYLTESYFRWVDKQDNLVYRLWRVLWQPITEDRRTNRTDCSGILVWYLVYLNAVGWRMTELWALDSYWLYSLWDPIKTADAKRWDVVYMEFDSWQRHVAVSCNDWATEIYDFYTDWKAFCRPRPKTTVFKVSKNVFVNIVKENNTKIEEISQAIDYINTIKNNEEYNIDIKEEKKTLIAMVKDFIVTNILGI